MQLIITLDGETYCGKVTKTPDEEMKKQLDIFYKSIDELNKMKLELENGDILIIGEEAVQKAVFIVRK